MSKTRKAISTRTRFEVFKRDGFRCSYCGAHPPDALLHVDHVVAVANGGSNDMDNLVTACGGCNLGKSAVPLTAVPQSMADKAAEVQERERQLQGYQAVFEAKRQRLEDETWRVMECLYGKGVETAPRDELSSVRRFIEKLGVHAVLEAAEIAMVAPVSTRKTFRYFCGICHNLIRKQAAHSAASPAAPVADEMDVQATARVAIEQFLTDGYVEPAELLSLLVGVLWARGALDHPSQLPAPDSLDMDALVAGFTGEVIARSADGWANAATVVRAIGAVRECIPPTNAVVSMLGALLACRNGNVNERGIEQAHLDAADLPPYPESHAAQIRGGL